MMRFGTTLLVLGLLLNAPRARADEIQCPDHSTRLRRDCAAESTLFERRLAGLTSRAERLPQARGLRASVRDAIATLSMGRAQLCQDYNVCDVAVTGHRLRLALIDREAAGLARLLDSQGRGDREAAASLATWASGLAGRLEAAATAGSPEAMANATPMAPRVTPQVLESMRTMQESMEGARQAQVLIGRALEALDQRDADGMPALCAEDAPVRLEIRRLIRSGNNSANIVSGVPRLVAMMCDPYLRWRAPSPDDQEHITRLLERVTQGRAALTAAGACNGHGEWTRECSRAYGRDATEGAATAAVVLDMFNKVELAVHGLTPTGRMTCDAPVWELLTRQDHRPGRMWSDLRRMGTEARRVCQGMEMWPTVREGREASFRTASEQWMASGSEVMRSYQSALARMRATFHIHE